MSTSESIHHVEISITLGDEQEVTIRANGNDDSITYLRSGSTNSLSAGDIKKVTVQLLEKLKVAYENKSPTIELAVDGTSIVASPE
ncbi:MAG: hypothetical protein O2983_16140 [Planctomycetota bacterium]|nr:hypothetical protein [Planctomycetota bacterium]MDA0920376.1 hypothetical protein [Planctomycetota bacterium]MDA1161134.1 hypothetical protein [Planctomycetota bacterium]